MLLFFPDVSDFWSANLHLLGFFLEDAGIGGLEVFQARWFLLKSHFKTLIHLRLHKNGGKVIMLFFFFKPEFLNSVYFFESLSCKNEWLLCVDWHVIEMVRVWNIQLLHNLSWHNFLMIFIEMVRVWNIQWLHMFSRLDLCLLIFLGSFSTSGVVSELPKNEFETLQRLNELDYQIDSKIKQDTPNNAIANDFSDVKISYIVSEDEQGVRGGEDTTFVEDFVIIRFSVFIGPVLDDIDYCHF